MNGLNVLVLVACFLIVIAGLFAVIVERTNERDEARAQLENAELRADQADIEARIAEGLLDRFRRDARVVIPIRRPTLRSVPTQREPSDFDWTPPENADDDYWLHIYDERGKHRG